MSKRTWVLVVLAIVPACKKKTGDAAQGGEIPTPFSAWMQPDAVKAWQGTFAGHLTVRTGGTMTMAGDPAAVVIKGGDATVFDGKAEHKLAFEIDTPCS